MASNSARAVPSSMGPGVRPRPRPSRDPGERERRGVPRADRRSLLPPAGQPAAGDRVPGRRDAGDRPRGQLDAVDQQRRRAAVVAAGIEAESEGPGPGRSAARGHGVPLAGRRSCGRSEARRRGRGGTTRRGPCPWRGARPRRRRVGGAHVGGDGVGTVLDVDGHRSGTPRPPRPEHPALPRRRRPAGVRASAATGRLSRGRTWWRRPPPTTARSSRPAGRAPPRPGRASPRGRRRRGTAPNGRPRTARRGRARRRTCGRAA